MSTSVEKWLEFLAKLSEKERPLSVYLTKKEGLKLWKFYQEGGTPDWPINGTMLVMGVTFAWGVKERKLKNEAFR